MGGTGGIRPRGGRTAGCLGEQWAPGARGQEESPDRRPWAAPAHCTREGWLTFLKCCEKEATAETTGGPISQNTSRLALQEECAGAWFGVRRAWRGVGGKVADL